MARNDGGPAFPRAASEFTKSGTMPDGNDAVAEQDGMSLRDYFAAHAPKIRWHHFHPQRPTPCPAEDWTGVPEYARNSASPTNWQAIDQWKADEEREYDIQWPYFYADAMLAQRAK